ncbi:integrase, catalytic region, zinc finger, CCHC-type containing protein, partial [Tanacetum coccineum]
MHNVTMCRRRGKGRGVRGNDKDLVLTDKLVTYDLEKKTIGWTEYNCSSSIKVTDEEPGNVYSVGAHNLSLADRISHCSNKLQRKTYDIGSFIKWFCRRTRKKKLCKADLEGDKERKIALSISKLKAARYLDFGLEELVPSLWVESEREYDISAVYGITHWWFRRKEFYINKHSESSDREAVRSQMRILSVMSSMQEDIQCAGSDTRPPMLDRTDFESWQQRIRLYCLGKDNGENIMKSIKEGPFHMGTVSDVIAGGTEGAIQQGPVRARVLNDLSAEEKERYKADIRATNILLQ